MTTAGPMAMPIITVVSSFGVSASSTIAASSQSAANMAMMSSGCRNPIPLAGTCYRCGPDPGRQGKMRLFLVVSGRRPQHEMAEGSGDRLVRIVLPGPRLEGDDAPALLHDRDVGEGVERAARAQIVDGESDRFGQSGRAELARHAEDRGGLEEGAGHAAMDRRQDRIADDLWRERHRQCVVVVDANAEAACERTVGERAVRIVRRLQRWIAG